MALHPAHLPLPAMYRTEDFLLRPLRTTDVVLDYAAVMASAAQLRIWSDSPWPADDFSLAGNLADLQMHQAEHESGDAYTFTVLTPDASRCLGCVYLTPLTLPMQAVCPDAAAPAAVRFWVRTADITHDLDRSLLAVLRAWLAAEWRFDCIVYPVNPSNLRQVALLQETGAELCLAYLRPDGQPWHVYG